MSSSLIVDLAERFTKKADLFLKELDLKVEKSKNEAATHIEKRECQFMANGYRQAVGHISEVIAELLVEEFKEVTSLSGEEFQLKIK